MPVEEVGGQRFQSAALEQQRARQRAEGLFQMPRDLDDEDGVDAVLFELGAALDALGRDADGLGQAQADKRLGAALEVAVARRDVLGPAVARLGDCGLRLGSRLLCHGPGRDIHPVALGRDHLLAQLVGLRAGEDDAPEAGRVEGALPALGREPRRAGQPERRIRKAPPAVEQPEGERREGLHAADFVQDQQAAALQQRLRVVERPRDAGGGMQHVRGDDHVVGAGRQPLLLGPLFDIEARRGEVRMGASVALVAMAQEALREIGIAVLGQGKPAPAQFIEHGFGGCSGARADLENARPRLPGHGLRDQFRDAAVVEVRDRVAAIDAGDQIERSVGEQHLGCLPPALEDLPQPAQSRGQQARLRGDFGVRFDQPRGLGAPVRRRLLAIFFFALLLFAPVFLALVLCDQPAQLGPQPPVRGRDAARIPAQKLLSGSGPGQRVDLLVKLWHAERRHGFGIEPKAHAARGLDARLGRVRQPHLPRQRRAELDRGHLARAAGQHPLHDLDSFRRPDRADAHPRHPLPVSRAGDHADLAPVAPVDHVHRVRRGAAQRLGIGVLPGAGGRVVALPGSAAERLRRREEAQPVERLRGEDLDQRPAARRLGTQHRFQRLGAHPPHAAVIEHQRRVDHPVNSSPARLDLRRRGPQLRLVGDVGLEVKRTNPVPRERRLPRLDLGIERPPSQPRHARSIAPHQVLAEDIAQTAGAARDHVHPALAEGALPRFGQIQARPGAGAAFPAADQRPLPVRAGRLGGKMLRHAPRTVVEQVAHAPARVLPRERRGEARQRRSIRRVRVGHEQIQFPVAVLPGQRLQRREPLPGGQSLAQNIDPLRRFARTQGAHHRTGRGKLVRQISAADQKRTAPGRPRRRLLQRRVPPVRQIQQAGCEGRFLRRAGCIRRAYGKILHAGQHTALGIRQQNTPAALAPLPHMRVKPLRKPRIPLVAAHRVGKRHPPARSARRRAALQRRVQPGRHRRRLRALDQPQSFAIPRPQRGHPAEDRTVLHPRPPVRLVKRRRIHSAAQLPLHSRQVDRLRACLLPHGPAAAVNHTGVVHQLPLQAIP